MTTLSKILLAVTPAGLAGGGVIDFYCNANVNPLLPAVLPVGAIAFGAFLIVFMLEKEMAKFDEEEAKKRQVIECNAITPAPRQNPAKINPDSRPQPPHDT